MASVGLRLRIDSLEYCSKPELRCDWRAGRFFAFGIAVGIEEKVFTHKLRSIWMYDWLGSIGGES